LLAVAEIYVSGLTADAGMKHAMLTGSPSTSDPLNFLSPVLEEVFSPCNGYFQKLTGRKY
jgi:hypothetical protein